MNIAVIGPGAIGCLFAAGLARAGHDLLLVDHDPARAALLRQRGVTIDDNNHQTWTVAVDAVALPDDENVALPVVEVVFVCVKAHATHTAAATLALLASEATTVVSLQNGLYNLDALQQSVPARRTVCGITAQGAILLGPGHVRHAGNGLTMLAAPVPAAATRSEHTARLLEGAGFATRTTADAASLVWSKLLINAAINPVTAIWNVPNGALLSDPALFATALQAALEVRQVAEARGIALLHSDTAAELRRVCTATISNISSMLQDCRRGRQTEIDEINGAVLREAAALGIQLPVNRMLLERVKASVAGPPA